MSSFWIYSELSIANNAKTISLEMLVRHSGFDMFIITHSVFDNGPEIGRDSLHLPTGGWGPRQIEIELYHMP